MPLGALLSFSRLSSMYARDKHVIKLCFCCINLFLLQRCLCQESRRAKGKLFFLSYSLTTTAKLSETPYSFWSLQMGSWKIGRNQQRVGIVTKVISPGSTPLTEEGKISYPLLSKFRLAGANIYIYPWDSNFGKNLLWALLFSFDPFLPRNGHCFLLSLFFALS